MGEWSAESRGVFQLVAFAMGLGAFGAAPIVARRRTLRPWHLWLPLVVALAIIPVALPMWNDLRTHAGGDASAWGRMGELIILMALAPLFCIAVGALLALLVVLPRYGFVDAETLAAMPREPWYRPLFRARSAHQARQRLMITLGAVAVFGILWLLGVRPGR